MPHKSQQMLALAESFIKKQLSLEKVREYQRMRRKLQFDTPSKSPTSTHFLTSTKRTHSRTLLESNTERKQIKSVHKKTIVHPSDHSKAINVFLEGVILDLNSLREKILRREYSRKSMKEIQWKTKLVNGVDETVAGEIKLCFQRIILALDIQTLKIKQQTSKTGENELGRVHKDNKWLIEQIESLVEENERLKSQGAGFIKHKK